MEGQAFQATRVGNIIRGEANPEMAGLAACISNRRRTRARNLRDRRNAQPTGRSRCV